MIDLGDPAMLAALAGRDVGAVFRLVLATGITQRELAELVRMSQSEVSAILKGRRVLAYNVLVRVAEGLGARRGSMGLAYGDEVAEVDEEMKRRALLGVASSALFGAPLLGELLELPASAASTPLPSRLGVSDVVALRNLTESLRGVARMYGGCAEVVSNVADKSLALLTVSAAEATGADMRLAVGELHTMAGWCCVDSGLHDAARGHFATAMDLGDAVAAFRHAGIQMCDSGAYDDGLKAFQIALVGRDDPWLHAETALPYAAMGYEQLALTAISRAREQPQTDPFDVADMDYVTSRVYERLGRIDTAESFACASVRKWSAVDVSKRDRVEADITLAVLHVGAGAPDGSILAKRAIDGVAPLRSVRARAKLSRLITALDKRGDSTCQDLAQGARTVAQRV